MRISATSLTNSEPVPPVPRPPKDQVYGLDLEV